MAKHEVKCPICGEIFDTNKIQAVRYGMRRYAHAACDPKNTNFVKMESQKVKKEETQEDRDLKILKDYINALYKGKANWALVMKQIKEYKENNKYSYSGMLKSLIYFHEIKGNPIDKERKGVGIIPFVYEDAKNYYYNIFITTQVNNNKDFAIYKEKIKEVTIKVPEIKKAKPKLFNLDD